MSVNEWVAPLFAIIGTVLGVALGAALSYYIQTKTQKNAWKKEITETVYAALYSNVKRLKTLLETGKFERINFANWSEFQNDYRYLHVKPDKFRQQLDDFSKKVEGYDSDMIRLINEVFPDIVRIASEKTFNQTANISIQVECQQTSGKFHMESYSPTECLRVRKHPRDLLMESYPESKIVSFSVNVGGFRVQVGNPPVDVNEAKFNEFWKLCLELEDENEIYKRVLRKQSELLNESKNIFNELEKRIVDIIP